MFKRFLPVPLLAGVFLGACQSNLYTSLEPEEVTARNAAPPGAAPGTCWGQDATPAVIETVTEQVLVQPADGQGSTPAVYRTETQQQIIKPRQDKWFETPCEAELTPEFTASVQRALKVRGHYRGPITGRLDGRTRAAIRAYQKPQGLDSGTLSLAAARQMGLAVIKTPGQSQPENPDVTLAAATPVQSTEAQAPADATQQEAKAQAKAEADRLAALQEAEDAARAAREQAQEKERLARAEAAAKAAEEARRRAEIQKAQAEKAKRARELEQALADEKARKERGLKSLPVSSEGY